VITPIEPSLFASLDPPRLAGARCANCGTVTFPALTGCAKCAGSNMAPVELAEHGTLWTYTVQDFEPKPPYRAPAGGFVPYPVGYVNLGDVVVEARLIDEAPEIGAPMRLTLLLLWDDVVTYAFERAS
jgi:uncharacterized protein